MQLLRPNIDWAVARSEFNALITEYPPLDEEVPMNFDTVIDGTPDQSDDRLDRARDYALRLDANLASCPTGHGFVNGKHFDMDDVSDF